jgi:SAM-dependent methyltransferase
MERLSEDEIDQYSISWTEHKHRYLCAKTLVHGQVLDLACGIGYGTHILSKSENVQIVFGVDYDYASIQLANRRYFPKCNFLVGLANEIPFQQKSFDSIVSFETLEHLTNPIHTLKEFRRVLRSDGLLIGSVPTLNFENFCRSEYGENIFHKQKFDIDSLREVLYKAFSNVWIGIARIDIVAGLFSESGKIQMNKSSYSCELPTSDLDLGSYFFIASNSIISEETLSLLGHKVHGLSYFRTEQNIRTFSINRTLGQQEEEIATLNRTLGQQEEEIATLNRTLGQQEEEIATLKQELNNRKF